MASVMNGMALTKVRPFGSTFLIFSDYAKAAIRLSALMELPVIYVFTHDSIGVGEDGPTHQPIEQLASLRSIPGMMVFRPADAAETTEAWRYILTLTHHPAALALTRQAVPTIDRIRYSAASGVAKGAYVLADADNGQPDVLLLATGSEVSLCLEARVRLATDGIQARVVSMPSWELFEAQPEEYRRTVLPSRVTARVAVEQGSPFGWSRYVGTEGECVCMTTFGASAPLKDLQAKFGFTTDNVVAAARRQLERSRK
jgi:transketolase